MVQILLVHNKFHWLDKLTYLSYLIRVGTCSKWNHVAIRIDDYVIEAVGKGVVKTPYRDWLVYSDRQVLPLTVDGVFNTDLVLSMEGTGYGFMDLWERLKEIKREKWDGKTEYIERDRKGVICSDLACIGLGIPKDLVPADLVTLPYLLHGEVFTTHKVR